MADKRRFDLFADLITTRFLAPRIFDVAGGMGKLNEALTRRGRDVTTFDRRHKHLPVKNFQERIFTLDEPCACELVVGMHPDGATRLIVEYAAKHHVPFAIVPCCSENGMSYKPWMRHLTELAKDAGFARVEEAMLPMDGRARVLVGEP
jgi:hypothetical protein